MIAALLALAATAFAMPARADEKAAVRRAPASFVTGMPEVGAPTGVRGNVGYNNGFLYLPGPQPLLNVGGRVPVGKSHVYVPYYGNVTGDPAHPTWQGAAGIAYGFRTWDISVVNGGFGSVQNALPGGGDAPRANPSLSLSIRF